MNSRFCTVFVIFFLFFFVINLVCLYAQEEPAAPLPEAPPVTTPLQDELPSDTPPVDVPVVETPVEILPLTPEQNRVNMDIRTSSFIELAAWCRSLGLSEGGTSTDLARRLREHFQITEQTPRGEDKRKVITIESARSTEYFSIEAVDEDYARLSGEVKVSLKDGEAVHRIQAWNILFNRTRNILTASGGVVYVKEEGDKVETFRGDSITVDLDNWESIFLGGTSERSVKSDETTYLFSGTVISKDTEDVTVLNKASISNANSEESLWSLNATRVWLLPGSDFAIFNAILKVGEIPVLYIPFFYYPADEVVFHPVIGYRSREGNFVQTTTYILGRPKAEAGSQSSFSTILGSSRDMEKKREGLFLRSTGKKAVDTNEVSLKAILDYYANLGGYLGMDLDLPAKGIMGATNLSLGIGVTRTIGKDGSNYSPFFPTYDGTSDWNKSNLFSLEVPFRYRLKTSSSLSGKYGSFSWNIPYYSDPLVDSDFLNRAEEMDWVSMVQSGAALDEETAAENQLGNYSWQLNGQISQLPKLEPYIIPSISGISSTLTFRTDRRVTDQNDVKYYSPTSFFYAPDFATLYSTSGSISGSLLSFGRTTAAASSSTSTKTETGTVEEEQPDPFYGIGALRSPFESREKEDAAKEEPFDKLVLPELTQTFDLPRTGNTRFSLDYRIDPTSASTLKFNYNKWKEYGDVNWSDISSVLFNLGGNASTTLNLSHSENLYSVAVSYSGNGAWRQYGYLNEEAEEFLTTASGTGDPVTDPAKVEQAKLQEYKNSFFSTSYEVRTTLRPLYRNSMFGASSLNYNLKGLAVKSSFLEDSTADAPTWEMIHGEWTKEKVDIHNVSSNISAVVMDKTQTISLTADLPPRDAALSWRTSFNLWITQTDTNMKILFPGDEEKQKLEPFYATEKLTFGSFGSFTQSLVLDPDNNGKVTTLTSSLNLTKWGLSAAYAAARMPGYEYITDSNAWVQKTGEETLQSRDFSLNFSKKLSMAELWNNRLQFSIDTSSRLFFDLQRYTSSSLTFSLGFTLGINKFLDLSLSTNSENAYIYRYFKGLPFFSDAPIDIPDGPQNNFFLDLINSFRFDNDDLRRLSGFKMKNFRISATHHLGDWKAILNWTMSPYRPINSRQYELNNEISFLVQWVPVSEIKSDILYNKRNTPEWTVK